MKLIGENIHIISKRTRTAIEEKDKEYIRNLAKKTNRCRLDRPEYRSCKKTAGDNEMAD